VAKLTPGEAEELVASALATAGATETMAWATARALVGAEARGLGGHGLSRIGQYRTHLVNGRANGRAEPRIVAEKPGACLIDAGNGLAYAAIEMAVAEATRRAKAVGVAFVGVTNSHHSGASGLHAEAVAAAGLICLMFTNSPSAMPAWGGRRPLFGTNPVAAAFPRRRAVPLVIDLSLSEVARGKIMVAAKKGEAIPLGWAVDRDGRPTTDAQAALEGAMLPAGGVKGAMLALVVELLCCAVTGANFGYEADSFFVDAGNQPRLGQAIVAVDPGALVGEAGYLDRVEALVAAMIADPGVRLPGARRDGLAQAAAASGIEIADATLAELRRLAGRA
jgi:(2R)-3-sulfolactate dehydrogenase (NADP+)